MASTVEALGGAVSIELPGTVIDVLYFIGLPWPGIDEDELRGWATDLREFASEITDVSRLTHDAVTGLKDSNESAFVKTVAQHWDHHHAQIMAMRGPMHAFADALDVAAGAVEIQKGAVITAAGALAIAVAATQGEALFTLGIAEAEVPAEVAIAKMAIKFALQELEMQLLSTLIDKAGKEISDHAGRSIANLLKGGAGVAFEAVSLKVDYQGLERVAQVAKAHASRAETASMRAHRKANARKLETHSAGGKWHVVAVLEAALKSIAEDIFRRLPGALHTVLLDTEKDLEKDIAALKEADARAAEAARSTPRGAEAAPGALALGAGGGKPPIEPPERPIGFAEEPPEEDPAAGAGQRSERATGNPESASAGVAGIPLDPQPSWHGSSADKMKHHRLPAVSVGHLPPEDQLAVLADESKRLADNALKDPNTVLTGKEPPVPPGEHKLQSGCAGSLLHDNVITAHTSTTKFSGQRLPHTHPVLKDLLDKIDTDWKEGRIPKKGQGHGKCAEVSLIGDRLAALDPTGETIRGLADAKQALEGAVIHTRRIGDYTDLATGDTWEHGGYLPPCDTCKHILPALGIHPHS